MSLINCPDCGKEVSDRANACIHCGCPLSMELNQKEDNYTGFYKVVLTEIGKNYVKTIGFVRELAGYSLKEAKETIDNVINNTPQVLFYGLTYDECETIKQVAKTYDAIVSIEKDIYSKSKNNVLDGKNIKALANPYYKPEKFTKCVKSNRPLKCPKCGSQNIQIVRRKWTLLAGFATNKVDRVCANCLYKW